MTTSKKAGFLDAPINGCFKIGRDGRRLVFPWSSFGRGYVVPSDEDYERLHRRFKTFTIVFALLLLGATFAPAALVGPGAAIVAGLSTAVLGVVFFAVWTRSALRGFAPTDERMTAQENWEIQARTYSAATLWTGAVSSLVLTALSFWMMKRDPGSWWQFPFAMFLGFAIGTIGMLVTRRRLFRN